MLTKQEFLNFALAGIAARGIQAPEDVEVQMDQLLALAPHLVEHRQYLIDEALAHVITAVGRCESMVDDDEDVRWLTSETSKAWVHWPWLKAYLGAEVRRPAQVMKELDDSTDEVIDLLGDPKREGIWDRRGLVVGHVQSGKTQHYTALTAKALDAGFKLVIILSGIHENLRQQTQERVEQVIIGKDSRNNFAHCGIRLWSNKRLRLCIEGDPTDGLPDISTLTSVAGDYGAAVNAQFHVTPGQAPVILVIKKNASILRNLLRWVTSIEDGAPLRVPTLVIDDEADHSSINTAATDPDTNPTTINLLIRKLLWRCDRVGFVGYTATPYANIFMDQNHVEKRAGRNLENEGSDLFPKSFITNLDSPTNYIGPETVFGHAGDESLGIPRRASLPMHERADDAETWLPPRHRKDWAVSPDLPISLREALRAFLLSTAARITLGHDTSHMSMLVHVSRFNDVQEQVTSHVQNELSSLIERLRHGDSAEQDWISLKEIWDRVFVRSYPSFAAHTSQQLIKPVMPDWPAVRRQVVSAFERMRFSNINSTTKESLDYMGTPEGLIVVAVGGDRLSRGLTLEGLSVSYFLRGAKAFDTLMQMGRWFGYRPGYAHLCRVYAPPAIVQNFRTIALATEELRREFSRMCFLNKRPTEYGLRVREPRADLLVTAMNKMRRGESVRVHFAESLVSSLDIPTAAAEANYSAFVRLVDAMEKESGQPVTGPTMVSGEKGSSYHYRWDAVDAEYVVEFLKRYRANVNVCFEEMNDGSTMISRFVESMNSKGELTGWTVALIGSSKMTRRAIDGREYRALNRNIDSDKATTRVNQHVFQSVAMGQDEAIDLTRTQYEEALSLYEQSEKRASKAGFFRMKRPPERGLLLLYPIIPRRDEEELRVAHPVIGVAVSLPSSTNDVGQDYVCNPRMLAELYGAEFADDSQRDAIEEAQPAT
ncbi:MAG: endonuclease [Betaproteobacteria bacterium]|nr:endonuclease [Betaproteobacteria bacterium]